MLKDMFIIICCISWSIFWSFILNISIKRIERALASFYLPLRDEHLKEYVKQSKAIKFIRKHTGLSDYDNIHWAYSVLHSLQIILVLGTPIVLSSRFFTTMEASFKLYIVFWITVTLVFNLFADGFGIVQSIRCSKIKKTNPKYAKCKVRRWNHF